MLTAAIACLGFVSVAACRVESLNVLDRSTRLLQDWDYNGKRIAGHIGNDIFVWDARTGSALRKFVGHEERIHFVLFDDAGKRVVTSAWIRPDPRPTGSKETSTRFWSLASGRQTDRIEGLILGDLTVDGTKMAGFKPVPGKLGFFAAVVVEAQASKKLIPVSNDTTGPMFDRLRFSPDGRTVTLLEGTSSASLYDVSSGALLGQNSALTGPILIDTAKGLLSVNRNGAELFSLRAKSTLHKSSRALDGDELKGDSNGETIAISNATGRVTLLKLGSDEALHTLQVKGRPLSVLLSPDARFLVIETMPMSSYPPVRMTLFAVESGKELTSIEIPAWGRVIGFSPDSKTLLLGGSPFIVLDTMTGKELKRLNLFAEPIKSFRWTTSGS